MTWPERFCPPNGTEWRISNPLAMRLPLFDPEPFLRRTQWIVAPAFTRLAAGAWLCLMALAIWLAAANWQDLAHRANDGGLLGANLLLVSLIYPVVKLLHELGHGYSTRHWGGEVREVGLLFLLFAPVPMSMPRNRRPLPQNGSALAWHRRGSLWN